MFSFQPTITLEEKLLFTKHLATLLRGGIPLVEGLRSLAETGARSGMKRILRSVIADIENGQTLSFAFEKFPKTFDVFYRSLVEIGEASGTLKESLGFLAVQIEKSHALKRKIVGVLLYPGFILGAAGLVGGLISVFVLPKLVPLFASFEADLPLATRILLSFAKTMREDGMLIAGGILIGLIGFSILVSLPFAKPLWQEFLLRLPLWGSFSKRMVLAAFCRDMALMLGRGIPLSRALSIEQSVTGNSVFRRYIERLETAISRGGTLEEELVSGKYHHIPSLAGKMIGVGERTGKLDESFQELAGFFEEEADVSAKNFAIALEPTLILLVGGLVAFVALAIITPLYTLTGSIHR